jgi:hypothetical protein
MEVTMGQSDRGLCLTQGSRTTRAGYPEISLERFSIVGITVAVQYSKRLARRAGSPMSAPHGGDANDPVYANPLRVKPWQPPKRFPIRSRLF